MKTYWNRSLGRWMTAGQDGKLITVARWKMQDHLGRLLATDEHVHHINGDKTDDRIENLAVIDIREHTRLHSAEQHAARRATWKSEWAQDHECCVECGGTDTKHMGKGLCGRCYRLKWRRSRGVKQRNVVQTFNAECCVCGTPISWTSRDRPKRTCSPSCKAQIIWEARRAA